jgi:ATP-binding cassette, subfamily F, member 3
MYYKISHGSVTLGNNTVLEDINFCVKDNEKIGIVGRNGCGKTTLLKAIVGEYEITSGYEEVDIISSENFNIGYVKQNDGYNLDMKMIDYIKSAFKDILDIEKKLNVLENEMSTNYDEKVLNKYNDLLSRYEYMGGYKYKKEIEVILSKFDFSDKDKEKYLNEFSGGQLTKLSLIKLLLSKPDLLILDEPTNHLDIKAIEWLEDYLKGYKGSIILVSHDRMFLDNVCNVIYDIG